MDVQNDEKSKINFNNNVLVLFENLTNKNSNVRQNAAANIFRAVWIKQQEVQNENELSKDLQYCVERLVKGLASSREAARLGFAVLLTEILKRFPIVQLQEVLELMKKHFFTTDKQDKRDAVFGQLFAYTAIVRSGRLQNHAYLSYVVTSLVDLFTGKTYIINASYEVILGIFSQLTAENFKDVWSHLKKKLPSSWEDSSTETFWLLLLSIRLFPEVISAKYMNKNWGGSDIFSADNLGHLKKLIKPCTSTLPHLHPLCTEFLLLSKKRKDFSELWNTLIDENLFLEHNAKSFLGFEMIKTVLNDSPTKKILKAVLSPKFRTVFSISYLNMKHTMNHAAVHLAEFLCAFATKNTVPEMQIVILKAFLQPPGTVLLDQILKKKEVSLIIRNLLPDAVKILCEMLKTVLLKKKSDDNSDKKVNNLKQFQATQQIANLISHPVMLTDMEWRIDVIKFLFLHSFFIIKETTSEIPHCEHNFEPLSDDLRDACMVAFFRAVNSLHGRTENQQSPLNSFLEQLMNLSDYAEKAMNAAENLEPKFPLEKVQNSWSLIRSMVHKLKKQSKKDNLINESNAFMVLFLQLGFHLFKDPDNISELVEELQMCCKKSLQSRKQETSSVEIEDEEPPWIGVVVDILLSLLSNSSSYMRSLVTYIFPLFSSFIDENALQQILDVINPQKSDEDMLVDEDESGGEDDQNVDFGSGSSSDESENEADNQPIDEEFKKKVQQALGPAAEDSEAESIVLSDSEMFKLDSALSDAFKSQVKSGHTQVKSEEKAMLNFRIRCFDLIISYLKSEPPMHLVLMCLEPVLAAFEFGHQGKHHKPLLQKSLSVLQLIARLKKFKHHDNVSKSELKRLLDVLISKCHKEIDMSVSQKLSSLCVFIVLCYRKLTNVESPEKKKKSKVPSYVKTYLSALETFASSGSTHMKATFFTQLMEACSDLAWYFTKPCRDYAFSDNIRLFKKTQCLGLLSESLKYSKSQKDISVSDWLEFAHGVFPLAIESVKKVMESPDIKALYLSELLHIMHTLDIIIKEKNNQSLLNEFADSLPSLNKECLVKLKKLNNRGRSLKAVINLLRKTAKVPENSNTEDQSDSQDDTGKKESKKKEKNLTAEISCNNIDNSDSDKNEGSIPESKSEISNEDCSKGDQPIKKKRKSVDLNKSVDYSNISLQEGSRKKKLKRKIFG